jgi:hypothetical protein
MACTVLTVDDVLRSSAVGCGIYEWGAEGGYIRLNEAQLRPALEAAYDPDNPDWAILVELPDELLYDSSFVDNF